MINRISGIEAPGDGRRDVRSAFFVPDTAARRSAWDDLGKRAERYIGDHPVASLAMGLALGIVIGCLLKRR